MSDDDKSKPQDTKTLNAEHEKAVVKAQWEQAKRLGLLEEHPKSINENKPADLKE